jgi:hypothetical protein
MARGQEVSPILLRDDRSDGARRRIGTAPDGFELVSWSLKGGHKRIEELCRADVGQLLDGAVVRNLLVGPSAFGARHG